MTLWLIKDGEKAGPFEDYEVREMIREGAVNQESRVWHEGADGWVKASEIDVLKGEFAQKEEPPEPIVLSFAPFLPWRRFGARAFDGLLYVTLLVVFFTILGSNQMSSDGPSGWFILWILIPAILMEAALLGSVGLTPGKWFMSLKVRTLLGTKLTTGQAVVRSMRVWILGMGMLQPILLFLGHCLSLWFGLKKGALLWDLQSGFHVPAEEIQTKRIVAYGTCIVLLLALNVGLALFLNWDEFQRQLQEEMKKNPLYS